MSSGQVLTGAVGFDSWLIVRDGGIRCRWIWWRRHEGRQVGDDDRLRYGEP